MQMCRASTPQYNMAEAGNKIKPIMLLKNYTGRTRVLKHQTSIFRWTSDQCSGQNLSQFPQSTICIQQSDSSRGKKAQVGMLVT